MIDVYGGIFLDIYVNGEKPHEKNIDIFPGGSGFNIALGLSILNNDVRFIGNIGNDLFKTKINEEFEKNNINIDYLKINDGKSDVFISENEKPFAVQRKNNDLEIDIPKKLSEYAFVNSEINPKSLNRILELDYRIIFIDTGPRHFLLNEYYKKKNHFLISNSNNNNITHEKCDLLKMDLKGFCYNNKFYSSNGKELTYKFGTGDLLDVLVIDSLIKNNLSHEKLMSFTKIIENTNKIKGAFNKILLLTK
ncbi:PfkB family carbohydrate kinase [Geotoga petraea]|jgi:hypothetical protein|uniref:PfkB family carbohydrate kinase n=1 Tax=Geotoga petraea TaxID=28234 RepID=A0A1G6JQK0_9BACT|nr:PfkB family carbohydrate kinase [Geotoga petraea]MDK2946608.1 hypothetical protein [Geotoga sp.]SDC21042.1 pfkB family carbohydrate kinase [Geotoga petraea]